jgi:hypothetical protein
MAASASSDPTADSIEPPAAGGKPANDEPAKPGTTAG